MVSRSPSNVLRGKQTETGAKQPRPRETGVFLQLCCYTDDWQPSAVDTQLPRWLFRSSVPTPSKAHNLTLQIDLSWISACFYKDYFYQRSNSFFSKQTSTRAYEHPGFILRLILDGTAIKFEPTFKEFEVIILNVYDVMIKASQQVPRVETKLYLDWVKIFNYMYYNVMSLIWGWGRESACFIKLMWFTLDKWMSFTSKWKNVVRVSKNGIDLEA